MYVYLCKFVYMYFYNFENKILKSVLYHFVHLSGQIFLLIYV